MLLVDNCGDIVGIRHNTKNRQKAKNTEKAVGSSGYYSGDRPVPDSMDGVHWCSIGGFVVIRTKLELS